MIIFEPSVFVKFKTPSLNEPVESFKSLAIVVAAMALLVAAKAIQSPSIKAFMEFFLFSSIYFYLVAASDLLFFGSEFFIDRAKHLRRVWVFWVNF